MTNQLQGQEMNRLWHTHLGIRELFAQVDQTCDQINEVFTQKAAEKLAVSQEKFGRIAAVFLPLSVTLSLLSVLFAGDFLPSYAKLAESSDKVFDWGNWYKVPHILAILTAAILAAASVVSCRLYRKKSPSEANPR